MVYISGGRVESSQSPWRLSIIPETFWGFINFIVLFFQTMINPSRTKYGDNHRSDYRSGGGGGGTGGGGGGPRRRMGGFGRGAGGPASPPMGGG